MKRWIWIVILVVVVGLAAWGVKKLFFSTDAASTAYKTSVVTRGDIAVTVTSTGAIQAVTTVEVGTQVSGILSKVLVDFNSKVKAGQVIAQIDPTMIKAQADDAMASLDRAKAQADQARRNMTRSKELFTKNLISEEESQDAQTALTLADASVKSAEATLVRLKANLRYATITSPIDGVVVDRKVDPGQTVAASLNSPVLFVIANDLTNMEVVANIDESDIGQIRDSMSAYFTVDAYPDEKFQAKVKQVRYAPVVTQNVVTYPVVLSTSNPNLRLRPGMTANLTFQVASRENTVRVPSMALRFSPPATGGGAKKNDSISRPGGNAARPDSLRRGGGGGRRPGGPGGFGATKPDSLSDMPGAPKPAVLWRVKGGTRLERVPVVIGLSDQTNTELISGDLKEGDTLATGLTEAKSAQVAQNPLMGGGGHAPGVGGMGGRH